jgi:hypothetical protein
MMSADSVSRSASISRRHLLTAAAGAGATVAVAGVVGAAEAGALTATAASPGSPAAGAGGPVVVHLRDVASGAMDVFSGTERVQIRDRALAERIARAADPHQTTTSL